MSNLVKINQQDIAVKEYHGQRVVTLKDIDLCHGRPEGTARKRFNDNRQHMVEGTDFFKITPSEFRTAIGNMDSRQQNDVTLITESGYLMLVKSFTDDLAWQVQRALVNTYFRKGTDESSDIAKVQAQQERAHAMLMNAKTRALKTIMQTVSDKKLSALAMQVFGLTAIEEVTGQAIDYRPECGNLYSAQQIADEVGSNRITVGKRATAAGIKTDEFGVTVLSKSEHGPKQVPTFMYNEKGRQKLKELFRH